MSLIEGVPVGHTHMLCCGFQEQDLSVLFHVWVLGGVYFFCGLSNKELQYQRSSRVLAGTMQKRELVKVPFDGCLFVTVVTMLPSSSGVW